MNKKTSQESNVQLFNGDANLLRQSYVSNV